MQSINAQNQLRGISASDMQLILEFIYTGQGESAFFMQSINAQNQLRGISASDMQLILEFIYTGQGESAFFLFLFLLLCANT
jgi:hypothetical protein